MSAPTTLAETWTAAQADAPIDPRATPAIQARRDYMRGALDCLLLQKAGATREQLLAECVQFGKAVGTPAEGAPSALPGRRERCPHGVSALNRCMRCD